MDTLPGDKKEAKVMQSTISRFACRMLVDRTEATQARIYAAGFDTSRNIFLGVSRFYILDCFFYIHITYDMIHLFIHIIALLFIAIDI